MQTRLYDGINTILIIHGDPCYPCPWPVITVSTNYSQVLLYLTVIIIDIIQTGYYTLCSKVVHVWFGFISNYDGLSGLYDEKVLH